MRWDRVIEGHQIPVDPYGLEISQRSDNLSLSASFLSILSACVSLPLKHFDELVAHSLHSKSYDNSMVILFPS